MTDEDLKPGGLKKSVSRALPVAVVLAVGAGLLWNHARAGEGVALPSPAVDDAGRESTREGRPIQDEERRLLGRLL